MTNPEDNPGEVTEVIPEEDTDALPALDDGDEDPDGAAGEEVGDDDLDDGDEG